MSEETACTGQELTTATVYISQTCRSCYKVEYRAHKLGVVRNTINVLLQISSVMLLPKNYKNLFTNKKVIAKNKNGRPIVFLEHCVYYK